jgi:hypothetical protein
MADIFDMADTWNNGATTFAAIKMNVTDTASAAASLLMDLQVGGTSRFRVTKTGNIEIGATSANLTLTPADNNLLTFAARDGITSLSLNHAAQSATFRLNNLDSALIGRLSGLIVGSAEPRLGFTSSDLNLPDVFILRDAADTLAQRRGVNAQAFNIYNTFTDASNYERARMGWTGNAFVIAPQAAGTGTTRVLHISGLPTSNPGPGILWNNAGTPAIGT